MLKKVRYFCLSFIFLWMIGYAHTKNAEETFLQGNDYYQKAEYQQALDCYQSIEHKGRAIYYNMGACYKYLGNPAEAIFCWHRALKGARYHEYDSIMDAIDGIQKEHGFFKERRLFQRIMFFFRRLFSPVSLFFMQLLLLCVWFLYCSSIGQKIQKNSLVLSLLYSLCILVSMFFLIIGIGIKYREYYYRQSITMVLETCNI